jgi:GH15 family glucan-1,4-alpha-glucosidase
MSSQPIENYGVIGNMRSVALVGMNGSIDLLCYPEFDSPTIFAALLDEDQSGRFQIEPCVANARIRQLYLPDTNTLLTRFLPDEVVADHSEQLGANGQHLGNFSQAFTHLALISAATYLDRTLAEKGDGVWR